MSIKKTTQQEQIIGEPFQVVIDLSLLVYSEKLAELSKGRFNLFDLLSNPTKYGVYRLFIPPSILELKASTEFEKALSFSSHKPKDDAKLIVRIVEKAREPLFRIAYESKEHLSQRETSIRSDILKAFKLEDFRDPSVRIFSEEIELCLMGIPILAIGESEPVILEKIRKLARHLKGRCRKAAEKYECWKVDKLSPLFGEALWWTGITLTPYLIFLAYKSPTLPESLLLGLTRSTVVFLATYIDGRIARRLFSRGGRVL